MACAEHSACFSSINNLQESVFAMTPQRGAYQNQNLLVPRSYRHFDLLQR